MGNKTDGRVFIAREGTWFKAGTTCVLVDDFSGEDGRGWQAGVFEGIHIIEEGEQRVKQHWAGLIAGTEVQDRELCPFDEFDVYGSKE